MNDQILDTLRKLQASAKDNIADAKSEAEWARDDGEEYSAGVARGIEYALPFMESIEAELRSLIERIAQDTLLSQPPIPPAPGQRELFIWTDDSD